MPPRRTRPLKSLKGRVQRLLTRSDFEKLLSKSNKRLVVVHYFTSSENAQKTQIHRGVIIKVSRHSQLGNVLFAEVDISQPELEGLASKHNVDTLPAFQLWRNQSVVETLTGMAMGSVLQRCIEHAGKSPADSPPSRWKRLLVGVMVVGVVGAAAYFGVQQQQSSKTRSPAAQLADVDAKIKDVKTRLAYVTRRKLHKAKREQQKKLKALEARRQAIVAGQRQHRIRVVKPVQDSDSDDSDSD